MLSLVGSLPAKITAVSQRLSLAGRKGRARTGSAAKSEALVSLPGAGDTGDTGDTAVAGTRSRGGHRARPLLTAGHVPFSPCQHRRRCTFRCPSNPFTQRVRIFGLKTAAVAFVPRWHLCRGGIRAAAADGRKRGGTTPTGGIARVPRVPAGPQRPVHHCGVAGAAGGGDGRTDRRGGREDSAGNRGRLRQSRWRRSAGRIRFLSGVGGVNISRSKPALRLDKDGRDLAQEQGRRWQ